MFLCFLLIAARAVIFCVLIINMKTGTKTLIYNLALFFIGVALVSMFGKQEAYKVGAIVLFIGILAINVYSIMCYIAYQKWLNDVKKKQNARLVPSQCPDYWVRSIDNRNNMICKNELRVQGQGGAKKFIIGTSPQSLNLNQIANQDDITTCQKVMNNSYGPWLDMSTKCEAKYGMEY
jgi:hypothetical protein